MFNRWFVSRKKYHKVLDNLFKADIRCEEIKLLAGKIWLELQEEKEKHNRKRDSKGRFIKN